MHTHWGENFATSIGVCERLVSGTAQLQHSNILVQDYLTGWNICILCIIGNSLPILFPHGTVLLVLDTEIVVAVPEYPHEHKRAQDYSNCSHNRTRCAACFFPESLHDNYSHIGKKKHNIGYPVKIYAMPIRTLFVLCVLDIFRNPLICRNTNSIYIFCGNSCITAIVILRNKIHRQRNYCQREHCHRQAVPVADIL